MKAILVIDMPKSCLECSLSKLYGSYCSATQSDTYTTEGDISSDCPLKPMPEKEEGSMWNTDIGEYYEGYNACIDEILGGNDEL